MLLDVRGIINTPGGRIDLRFEQDLSDVDFGGVCPAVRPVLVVGQVRNIAGMLRLQLEVDTTLACVCDRCGTTFDKPFHLSLEYLLAEELEDAGFSVTKVGDLARPSDFMNAPTTGYFAALNL